ncbi:unnamed protein product [Prorocentrum cordatum]|uniref:Protein kinase domain-containing protein n=1 Tax=Prorocentrum cordatum TaxID=2364126 RepID=A0ABN9WYB0_9DINO|nr:unnamed protein product [Polarella glacialis]
MVAFVLATPHYAGRLLGLDTKTHLEPRQLTDTFVVLGLDALVTSTHIVLPIRYHLMLCVQVCSIFCYAIPAMVLGSAHPGNFPHTMVAFSMLIFVTALGKRSLDREERIHYLALIREKCLRFESEFQLATYKDKHKAQKMKQKAPDDAESDNQSMSATSFGNGSSRLTFKALVELGLREQWLIDEQEVQLPSASNARPLGEGGFGIVVRGRYHGANVALKAPKTILQGRTQEVFLEASCNELRMLRRLRHPNIVALYGAVLTSGVEGVQVCLVLELIEGESLKMLMTRIVEREELAHPSFVALRIRVLRHVAAALCYLHSRQPVVVHGDIKNTNIFVQQLGDCSMQAKLLDFGLSRLVKGRGGDRPMGGTLRWAAPEVLPGRHAPAAATDMFSFGRLVFYVSSGHVQEGKKHTDTINRRFPRKYGKIWEVGGKTETQKIWENMGNPFICVYLFVCPGAPSHLRLQRPCALLGGGGQAAAQVPAPLPPRALAAGLRGGPPEPLPAPRGGVPRARGPSSAPASRRSSRSSWAWRVRPPRPGPRAAPPARSRHRRRHRGTRRRSSASSPSSRSTPSTQLAAVPESAVVIPSSPADTGLVQGERLVHSSYLPTPHETLLKAVGFVLMQSNHGVDASEGCCWMHAGLRRLRIVCSEMQEMPCDGWDVPVSGQCKDCRLLCIDGGAKMGACNFCGGGISDPLTAEARPLDLHRN